MSGRTESPIKEQIDCVYWLRKKSNLIETDQWGVVGIEILVHLEIEFVDRLVGARFTRIYEKKLEVILAYPQFAIECAGAKFITQRLEQSRKMDIFDHQSSQGWHLTNERTNIRRTQLGREAHVEVFQLFQLCQCHQTRTGQAVKAERKRAQIGQIGCNFFRQFIVQRKVFGVQLFQVWIRSEKFDQILHKTAGNPSQRKRLKTRQNGQVVQVSFPKVKRNIAQPVESRKNLMRQPLLVCLLQKAYFDGLQRIYAPFSKRIQSSVDDVVHGERSERRAERTKKDSSVRIGRIIANKFNVRQFWV